MRKQASGYQHMHFKYNSYSHYILRYHNVKVCSCRQAKEQQVATGNSAARVSLVPRPNFSRMQRTDGLIFRDRLSVRYVNVSGKFGRGQG